MVRKGTLPEMPNRFSSLDFRFEHPKQLPAGLLKLDEPLNTLPPFGELIPSRPELTSTHAMPAMEIEYDLGVRFTSIQENPVDGAKGNIASNKDSKATATKATEDLDAISPEKKNPGGSSYILEVKTEMIARRTKTRAIVSSE